MDDESDDVSEYEKLRLKKIEENRRCLAELGLGLLSNVSSPQSLKEPKGNSPPKSAKKRRQSTATPVPARRIVTRRSVQLGSEYQHGSIEGDEDDQEARPTKKKEYRENFFGAVEGVKVGDCWEYRLDCSMTGVHRPTVAGIHGGADGAYSIALSGGYEDDIDYGDHFTYTGAGGRDLKGTKANPKNLRTAPQSKDQTPDGYNAALIASVGTQNPVRVIRGYKLSSLFAPESGYRYDGLYTVDKYWTEIGLAGFLVYKFSLSRIKGQDPPVWELDTNQENSKQHINCRRTQGSRSSSSPQSKNTGFKLKSPAKESHHIVDSCDSNEDLRKTNCILNGSPPSKPESQKISPFAAGEEATKSPTKILSASRISPEKCQVQANAVKTPLKCSSSVPQACTNSSDTVVNNQNISSKKKTVILAVASKSPPKSKSLINGKESIHRFFPTISHTKKISPKKSLVQGNASKDTPTKIVSPPTTSSNEMEEKVVEPLKINVSRSPYVVRSGEVRNEFSPLNVQQSPIVKSPIKTSQPNESNSPKEVVIQKVVGTLTIASPCKVSSPAESHSPKIPTPERTTKPEQTESSQEKKGERITSGVSPTPSKVSCIPDENISFKRNLFNADLNFVPNSSETVNIDPNKLSPNKQSPNKQSPNKQSPNKQSTNKQSPTNLFFNSKPSPENIWNTKVISSSLLVNGTMSPGTGSPSKMFESPKKLRLITSKLSPPNSAVSKVEDSLNTLKSPPASDQKKSKPSNTLDRYLVKKFASNDFSRSKRPEFRKISYSNSSNESDDESIPAFIGFNEITINNSRNRLRLLSDFFPSIMKKQMYRTKLNLFKRTKKTSELTRCSSSKREFITSVDKIRDLSTKISNMSKFDPNAGFIPECFVKCSKIDSETSSSDEEKQLVESEDSTSEKVFFFGESCSNSASSDSSASKKRLSPQKLLDLVSSDEENDSEPFLGFSDVSTRSIIRNAFLIQKYAKVPSKY